MFNRSFTIAGALNYVLSNLPPMIPLQPTRQPLPRRSQKRSNRPAEISPRHRQYIKDERRRVRESLKALGLSRNVHEWG